MPPNIDLQNFKGILFDNDGFYYDFVSTIELKSSIFKKGGDQYLEVKYPNYIMNNPVMNEKIPAKIYRTL